MNKASLAFVSLLVATVLPVVSLHAAAAGPKARIFAKYDTNKNGVIDGGEVAVVQKAFAADPKGEFARYDTDKDGKLSVAEVAEIKPPGARQGGGHKASKDSAAPKPAPKSP